jgi:hypothetical protein
MATAGCRLERPFLGSVCGMLITGPGTCAQKKVLEKSRPLPLPPPLQVLHQAIQLLN